MNKHPKANYIIIPAGGSLVGDIDSLKGKSSEEVQAVVNRMLRNSGARTTKENIMDRQALIILAEMLDKARRQANSIEATAPEYGVYGKIKYALVDTLTLITEDYRIAQDVYQSILDGNTVRQALEGEGQL